MNLQELIQTLQVLLLEHGNIPTAIRDERYTKSNIYWDLDIHVSEDADGKFVVFD
jgi:hypothetical protein